MLVIQIYRHCSEHILARQWEVKGKRAKLRKKSEVFFFFQYEVKWWGKRFQVSLDNCQGFSTPDGGGKFNPPARNGEWKRSGEWFCASLWRGVAPSQISDFLRGCRCCRCWACGCSISKHQCLELDASCNREPVQGDKERCDMCSFRFA